MYIGFATNTFQRGFAQIIPTCHFKSNPFNALPCGPADFFHPFRRMAWSGSRPSTTASSWTEAWRHRRGDGDLRRRKDAGSGDGLAMVSSFYLDVCCLIFPNSHIQNVRNPWNMLEEEYIWEDQQMLLFFHGNISKIHGTFLLFGSVRLLAVAEPR